MVHLDLDTFFVSAERKRNSALNGIPLLIGGSSDRGVVASCSYEARKYGVRSAMPMRTARMLCPNAIVIKGDMDYYSRESSLVTQVIADRAPLFEKASIDEHYLDITGMDRFFGCLKWTTELKQAIMKETGLPITFALSVNKTVAKIGTGEAKPNGAKEIPQSLVRPFLNPLSIQRIPGIGEQTGLKLRSLGISIIQELSEMPVRSLKKMLGESGKSIWEKANGIDNSPVVAYTEQKSISTEETFQQDTTDVTFLQSKLVQMVEKLAYQLRASNKLTSCITVKIRYSDFNTESKQQTIPYTAYDHTLINKAKELLEKLYNRRLLVRMLSVKLSGLTYGNQQISLFEESTQLVQLYQAMDRMRNRYGKDAVRRAI